MPAIMKSNNPSSNTTEVNGNQSVYHKSVIISKIIKPVI